MVIIIIVNIDYEQPPAADNSDTEASLVRSVPPKRWNSIIPLCIEKICSSFKSGSQFRFQGWESIGLLETHVFFCS